MMQKGNFRVGIAEHTITNSGYEAITFDLCYERFVHAEFLTHRAFARNASSARAIPYRAKQAGKMDMINWILRDPAMPLHLGNNKPGMQSGKEIEEVRQARQYILDMLDNDIAACDVLHDRFGIHKEVVNRYIEAWSWINVVMTTGRAGLMNFFKLRIDKYAHPTIQRLAVNMARQYRESVPRKLAEGAWHLPFITDEQWKAYADAGDPTKITDLITWSVARSAWCSFKTVDDRIATWADASRRYEDCINLKHMTPCEHQLRVLHGRGTTGCIPGYEQFRHTIPSESAESFDFTILDKYANCDYLLP